MMNNDESRLVYSSEQGRMCPKCNQPQAHCRCKNHQQALVSNGVVRISYEKKGRKGKGVTLISGIPLTEKELKNFAKQLKKRCGSGGSIKEGVLEIQGDQRDTVIPILQSQSWNVKCCGG